MIKRIFAALFDILTAAFLAAGFVLQHFLDTKLGMVRWLNYNEAKYLNPLPLTAIRIGMIAVSVLLLVLTVMMIRKSAAKGALKIWNLILTFVQFAVTFLFGYFALTQSIKTVRGYHFFVIFTFLALICLTVRQLIRMEKKH